MKKLVVGIHSLVLFSLIFFSQTQNAQAECRYKCVHAFFFGYYYEFVSKGSCDHYAYCNKPNENDPDVMECNQSNRNEYEEGKCDNYPE